MKIPSIVGHWLLVIGHLWLFFVLCSFFFSPESVWSAPLVPNDPSYPDQWYLQAIHAPEAWEKTTGSREVVVAVLDVGVEVAHPDLMDNIWTNPDEIAFNGLDDDHNGYIDDIHGWDFLANDPNPGPDFQASSSAGGFHHGTLIAGLIGAVGNNGTDGVGVNWQVKIMPLKVLNEKGEGGVKTVVQAIDYAIKKKVDIINLSFINDFGDIPSEQLLRAIQRANQAGLVIVAAAGNDAGSNNLIGGDLDFNPRFPVCYDGPNGEPWWVIGVAALDQNDQKTIFSDYGFRCVDISAPGVNMVSTLVYQPNREGFEKSFGGTWSGTSLAAPLVTGAVALIKSWRPDFGPKEIYDILTQSADNIDLKNPFYLRQLGAGKLNLARALALLEKMSPAKTIVESQSKIVVFAPRLSSQLNFYNQNGEKINEFSVYPKYRIGISLASADFNKDGQLELVVGAGEGGGPQVRIFNQAGQLLSGGFFAYPQHYRSGVDLAVGDVNGDGQIEIVTVPAGAGRYAPEVKIFKEDGRLLNSFLISNRRSTQGLAVETIDLDKDGRSEIVVFERFSEKWQISVFRDNGSQWQEILSWSAKSNSRQPGLVIGDVDGDGAVEIALAKKGIVEIFSLTGLLKQSFLAYNKYQGDLALVLGDWDKDGRLELMTAPTVKNPTLKLWTAAGVKKAEFQIKGDYRQGIGIILD